MYCLQSILNAERVEPPGRPLDALLRELVSSALTLRDARGVELNKLVLGPDLSALRLPSETDSLTLAGCLWDWARLYRVSEGDWQLFHLLGVGESEDIDPPVYHLAMAREKPGRYKNFRNCPARVEKAEVLDRGALRLLLEDLLWPAKVGSAHARELLTPPSRVVWLGPLAAEGQSVALKIERVTSPILGIQTVTVASDQSPASAQKAIGERAPFAGGFVWRARAGKVGTTFPAEAAGGFVAYCDERTVDGMLRCFARWVEAELKPTLAERAAVPSAVKLDETADSYLGFMVHSMVQHSKMGVCNHCDIEQVVSPIQARGGHVDRAKEMVRSNSNKYRAGSASPELFLRKERGSEVLYFLNPRALEMVNHLLRQTGFPEMARRQRSTGADA